MEKKRQIDVFRGKLSMDASPKVTRQILTIDKPLFTTHDVDHNIVHRL